MLAVCESLSVNVVVAGSCIRRGAIHGLVFALVLVIAGGIAAGVWWSRARGVSHPVADGKTAPALAVVAAPVEPSVSQPQPADVTATPHTVESAPVPAVSPAPGSAPSAKLTFPSAATAQPNARVPFDAKAFAADPAAWCAAVEPGRIWTVADPAPGIIALRPLSPVGVTIPAGGSTTLHVRALAGAPVTFASAHYGAFANGADTHSVIADADGVATAVFTAIPGTVAFAQITAASPLTSGQVGFTVEIIAPDDAGVPAITSAQE